MQRFSIVGKSVCRVDALSKVTGEAKYADDIVLPGMLCGKILRSIYPHARILSINTEKAQKLTGVRAVVTAKDVPDRTHGTSIRDQGILARKKVRYVCEPVVAVAAVDEHSAQEALELIDIEYEELPGVFDPIEAMKPDAPLIHEELSSYKIFFEQTEKSMTGNINYHGIINHGDINQGFRESEIIFDDVFTTPKVHQCYLEPHTAVASFDNSGRVTVWTTTQRPHINQVNIAALLGLPMTKIRVIACHVGGAFGAKNRTLVEPICVALAQKSKRPVKLSFSREEEFTSATTRHSSRIRMKTGVKRDGTLVARQVELIYDCGAYAPTSNVIWLGMITAPGPYRIPHVKVEGFSVYTNKTIASAFRGFGGPQAAFAYESQMDIIANELKIDPVEIRLKNCFRQGDSLAIGQKLISVNVDKTILEATGRFKQLGGRKGRYAGVGIASVIFSCGGFPSSCLVRLNQDGTVIVNSGGVDLGQGLKTILSQIVAEELGVCLEDIEVVLGDTDSTPFDIGLFNDRGTYTIGLAAMEAANDLKKQILNMAGQYLEENHENLEVKQGEISVKGNPERCVRLSELAGGLVERGQKRGPLIGKASVYPDTPTVDINKVKGSPGRTYPTFTFATNVVEVEVDPETGHVTVLKAIGAHDCGTVMNPMALEGQIMGGMAIGLGYGLLEEIQIEKGIVLNPNFLEYKLPLATDIPEMEVFAVESYDEGGPFGAKGVGNSSVLGMAPAIANAIYNAVGIRVKELPITEGKILSALKKVEEEDGR